MSLNVTYHQRGEAPDLAYASDSNAWPPVTSQEIVALASSGAVQPEAVLARLAANADCHVEIGVSPTATTASFKIFSGTVEPVFIPAGSRLHVVTA